MIHAGRSYLELEARYRARVRKAGVISILLAVAAFLLPPAREARTEARFFGLRGPERFAGELSPEKFPFEEIEAHARSRVAAGALEWVEIIIEDEPLVGETLPVPAEKGPEPTREARREGRASIGPLRQVQPEVAIEVTLTEGLAAASVSRPSTRLDEFAILTLVRPDYPEISLKQEVEGLVTLRAVVNPRGAVVDVTTLSNEADFYCEVAALDALKDWRFVPLRVDEEPVWFSVLVPFRFRLID